MPDKTPQDRPACGVIINPETTHYCAVNGLNLPPDKHQSVDADVTDLMAIKRLRRDLGDSMALAYAKEIEALISRTAREAVKSFADKIVAKTLRHPKPRPSRSWIRLMIAAELSALEQEAALQSEQEGSK